MYKLNLVRAKNYALAFLNVYYPEEIPVRLIDGLNQASLFLSQERSFFTLLCSSAVSLADRDRILEMFLKKFSLPDQILILLKFIADRGEALIVRPIFDQIVREGGHRRGEEMCSISSSHELSEDERNRILGLLSRAVGRTLVSRFSIDPTLLCGVKAKGETFVWEKSIARRLMLMDRAVERGGIS